MPDSNLQCPLCESPFRPEGESRPKDADHCSVRRKANNTVPIYQVRCYRCNMRGPEMPTRKAAREAWRRLGFPAHMDGSSMTVGELRQQFAEIPT